MISLCPARSSRHEAISGALGTKARCGVGQVLGGDSIRQRLDQSGQRSRSVDRDADDAETGDARWGQHRRAERGIAEGPAPLGPLALQLEVAQKVVLRGILARWRRVFRHWGLPYATMSEAKGDVRATDRRSLPLVVRALNGYGRIVRRIRPSHGRLNADALVSKAQESAKLDDFGADGWQEGFEILVDSINDEGNLEPAGGG